MKVKNIPSTAKAIQTHARLISVDSNKVFATFWALVLSDFDANFLDRLLIAYVVLNVCQGRFFFNMFLAWSITLEIGQKQAYA